MRTFRNASNPRHETLVPKTLPLVVDRLEHDRVDVATDVVAGLVDDDSETLGLEHGPGLVADDLVVVHQVESSGRFEKEVRFAQHGHGSDEIERIAAGHRHEDEPPLAFIPTDQVMGRSIDGGVSRPTRLITKVHCLEGWNVPSRGPRASLLICRIAPK